MEKLTIQELFKYLEDKGLSEETRKKLEGINCSYLIIIYLNYIAMNVGN